ncbi:hypothetical protein ACFSX9_09635 [Flavobacterium ardleyense]|uniref:TonB C-terminal domain-containing protein n=1 Tax=Flavobacterium ardleyense TaxID=2038737 RepID=A0ABW5Z8D9_9FLAO
MKHIILIFFLFGVLNSNFLLAQTSSFKYYNFQFKNLEVGDEVFDEAEKKRINSDEVIVSLVINSDCKAEKFKIESPGKLNSFNLEIEKQAKKIMVKFQEEIKCNNKIPTIYRFPIKIKFSS